MVFQTLPDFSEVRPISNCADWHIDGIDVLVDHALVAGLGAAHRHRVGAVDRDAHGRIRRVRGRADQVETRRVVGRIGIEAHVQRARGRRTGRRAVPSGVQHAVRQHRTRSADIDDAQLAALEERRPGRSPTQRHQASAAWSPAPRRRSRSARCGSSAGRWRRLRTCRSSDSARAASRCSCPMIMSGWVACRTCLLMVVVFP